MWLWLWHSLAEIVAPDCTVELRNWVGIDSLRTATHANYPGLLATER